MTVAAAFSQIVSIIEGVTPSTLGGTAATGAFRLVKEADESRTPDTRGVWIETRSIGNVGPYQARHLALEVAVYVFYRRSTNRHKLNLAITDDYARLSAAIMSPSNWSPSTTGIRTLTRGEPMIPSTLTTTDSGAILEMVFTIEVQP